MAKESTRSRPHDSPSDTRPDTSKNCSGDSSDGGLKLEELAQILNAAGLGNWQLSLRTQELIASQRHREFLGESVDFPLRTREDWFGRILQEDLPDFEARQRAALQSTASTFENHYRVLRSDGQVRYLKSHALILRETSGAPIRLVGVTEDVTETRAAQQKLSKLTHSLEQQVADRMSMLKVLQDVAMACNQAHTVDESMLSAMEQICQYDGWIIGHIYRLADDQSGDLISSSRWHRVPKHPLSEQQLAVFNRYQEATQPVRIPPEDLWIGRVRATGRPQIIDDFKQMIAPHRPPDSLGLRAAIAFPILIVDEVAAVMEFFADHPIRNEQPFMEVMYHVGIQLGHVIRRQRLEKGIAEATHQQQRHFGRELHDSIAQQLTGISMLAQTIQESLLARQQPETESAQALVGHLRRAHDQVRRLSHGLMPVDIDGEGLVQALSELVDTSQELYGVTCELNAPDLFRIEDQEKRIHLYRIAQEAIQNAAKHANASRILVTLSQDENEVILTVEDNGRGFDPSLQFHAASGQQIMRSRANLLGGSITMTSEPDRGATIQCRIPLL